MTLRIHDCNITELGRVPEYASEISNHTFVLFPSGRKFGYVYWILHSLMTRNLYSSAMHDCLLITEILVRYLFILISNC